MVSGNPPASRMQTITLLTSTSFLGHIFCHACLMEALIAGEQQGTDPGKGISKCPVCRKKVIRPKDNKPSTQVIPLEIKLMTKGGLGKRKDTGGKVA